MLNLPAKQPFLRYSYCGHSCQGLAQRLAAGGQRGRQEGKAEGAGEWEGWRAGSREAAQRRQEKASQLPALLAGGQLRLGGLRASSGECREASLWLPQERMEQEQEGSRVGTTPPVLPPPLPTRDSGVPVASPALQAQHLASWAGGTVCWWLPKAGGLASPLQRGGTEAARACTGERSRWGTRGKCYYRLNLFYRALSRNPREGGQGGAGGGV